jgi:hypothetical protein
MENPLTPLIGRASLKGEPKIAAVHAADPRIEVSSDEVSRHHRRPVLT